jgi:hypothetical protein
MFIFTNKPLQDYAYYNVVADSTTWPLFLEQPYLTSIA